MNAKYSNKGQILVLAAFGIFFIIGVASLSVDLGNIMAEKAVMQSAVDAAALAGARELPNQTSAQLRVVDFLNRNGYDVSRSDVGYSCDWNPTGNNPNWYRVNLRKNVGNFFARVLGYNEGTVSVMATAEYFALMPMNINGGGQYGANGIMTLSLFGPYAPYTYGDCFSTKYLNDGRPNGDYKGEGYDFRFTIPANYADLNGTTVVNFEIFDPDTWNIGNAMDAGAGKVDEIRSPTSDVSAKATADEIADEAYESDGTYNRYTNTRYSLYAPDDTPNDYSDDVLIASAEYGPGDTATDMQWITPDGFSVDINNFGTGDYRLNIRATNGASENGFNLRAGPPLAVDEDFDPNNGTDVKAVGYLPINFNGSGTVTIDMGYIPQEAEGMTVHVLNFDTDVGAKAVSYAVDGNTYPGSLSSNGTWAENTFTLPSSGFNGGTLQATYQAGLQDTSVWCMYFEGVIDGMAGKVHLVQ